MGWSKGVGAAAIACSLAGCGSLAGLAYPQEIPVPSGARVIATDEGSDNDEPMRSRLAVVDIGDEPVGALVGFYRDRFSAADGFTEQSVADDQVLCLLRQQENGALNLVEIVAYRGTRVPTNHGRYLVSKTTFAQSIDDPCGYTHMWTPPDLLDPALFADP